MDKTVADQLFGEIYERTYKELSTYVISHIRNVEDARDLLQITYTSFYKRLRNKGSIPMEAAICYLKTTAKHEMGRHYGYMRKKERDLPIDDEKISQEVLAEIASDSFEDSVLDSMILQQIWNYIEKKGGLTYRIFILRYTYNLSLEQTAESLSIPLSSVTNRIYRTINEMQEVFSQELTAEQATLRKEPIIE